PIPARLSGALGRVALAFAGAAMLLGALVAPATAQRSISVIRDAEAERLIAEYAAPILAAAGFRTGSVEIVIVNDDRFNAFVADGNHIFINAGTIIQSMTPNELAGVIAHETGHLVGGNLSRIRDAMVRAQLIAAIGMLAGVAAAASGAG